MVQTTLISNLAKLATKFWLRELKNTQLNLFTIDYEDVRMYRTFQLRARIPEHIYSKFKREACKRIERELSYTNQLQINYQHTPDKVLLDCMQKCELPFIVFLPHSQVKIDKGSKRVEFWQNGRLISSKKM